MKHSKLVSFEGVDGKVSERREAVLTPLNHHVHSMTGIRNAAKRLEQAYAEWLLMVLPTPNW